MIRLGNASYNKNRFLSSIAQITSPSPQLVPLFFDVKNNVLAPITETSNDDYDNDWSDNCDYNFGTLDDFGVKNTENQYTIDALA